MSFFPDLKDEEEDLVSTDHLALYATDDGWYLDDDVNMEQYLTAHCDLNDKDQTKVSDFLAKSVPGSFLRIPEDGIVVIIDTEL